MRCKSNKFIGIIGIIRIIGITETTLIIRLVDKIMELSKQFIKIMLKQFITTMIFKKMCLHLHVCFS